MTRLAKRPGKIHAGRCEHSFCDWCPQGCFDEQPAVETFDELFDEFQRRLKQREYCIGWHPLDSQKRTYHNVLYDSWHEAEEVAAGMRQDQPGMVFFVDTANVTKRCDCCDGTGLESVHDACSHCHGKGRVRE